MSEECKLGPGGHVYSGGMSFLGTDSSWGGARTCECGAKKEYHYFHKQDREGDWERYTDVEGQTRLVEW